MEDQKYFVPDISDLRVGYTCNIRRSADSEWTMWLYIAKKTVSSACELLERGDLRVPYLTPEQIQKEGWIWAFDGGTIDHQGNPMMVFKKPKLLLSYKCTDITLQDVCIEKNYGNGVLYRGECRDINTLRYIQKLLNIK